MAELENYTFLTRRAVVSRPTVYACTREQILKGFSNISGKCKPTLSLDGTENIGFGNGAPCHFPACPLRQFIHLPEKLRNPAWFAVVGCSHNHAAIETG
jgi:hypothetical protein